MSTTPLEYYGTGKRKTSIARVHLRPGAGEYRLNDRSLDDYFGGIEPLKQIVKQPFAITETIDKFDVVVTVRGGGVVAQAVRHAPRHRPGTVRVQLRAAPAPEEGRFPAARRAYQGTEEVRAEGRSRPIPVQQALIPDLPPQAPLPRPLAGWGGEIEPREGPESSAGETAGAVT